MDNLELLELIKFNFKDDLKGISTPRHNRVLIEVNPTILFKVARYLFREHQLRFIIASAMDTGSGLDILYHFSRDSTGMMFNLKVSLPYEKPEIDSLVPLFVAADWIEREMHELFGIMFSGHPNLVPLISEGNWELDKYPYRKNKTEHPQP